MRGTCAIFTCNSLAAAGAEWAAVGLVAPYFLAVGVQFDDAVVDAARHQGVPVGQARHGDWALDRRLPKLGAVPIELGNAVVGIKRDEDTAIGEDFDGAAE